MRNDATNKSYNGVLDNSLSAIDQAYRQLRFATGTPTPTVLALRIQLCGTLLEEISDVRNNLVEYLEWTRARGRSPRQMECVRSDLFQADSSKSR